MKLIRSRPRVTALSATALALAGATLVSAMVWYTLQTPWTAPPEPGQRASVTHRVPSLGLYEDFRERPLHRVQPVQIDAGEKVSLKTSELLKAHARGKRPPSLAYSLGLLAFAMTVFLFSIHGIRYLSRDGDLLRPLVAVTLSTVFALGLSLLFLYLTPLPTLLLPLPLLAYSLTKAGDRPTGLLTGLTVVLCVSMANDFDMIIATTFGAQVAAVTFSGRIQRRGFLYAVTLWTWVTVVGLVVYSAYRFSTMGRLPAGDTESLMNSQLMALVGSGFIMGVLSPAFSRAYERLLGSLPKNRLQKLADFSNPLLERVAKKSPGTWQHTLAMANMAEQVANAIGADAILSRVGALYHDIGKSKQPEYFAENLRGDPSPHTHMPPALSADAIIAHVTDGVRMGREGGLPERVIDFIHMHHGDTVLEFFWHKNVELGNPDGLKKEDFRYPGLRPQTKETGILAIVDSVEAASRSLNEPDADTLEDLVRRIVFGKMMKRQLDESGLSVQDLTVMVDTLTQMLKSQFHIRPEYPWQRKKGSGGGKKGKDGDTPQIKEARVETHSSEERDAETNDGEDVSDSSPLDDDEEVVELEPKKRASSQAPVVG